MTTLWHMQALLMSVAKEELSRPHFSFSDNACQQWEFNGHLSTVAEFSRLVQSCIAEAQEVFKAELLLRYPLASFGLLALLTIIDDPSRLKAGYSFFTNECNHLVQFNAALISCVMNDQDATRTHLFYSRVSSGKILYKPDAC